MLERGREETEQKLAAHVIGRVQAVGQNFFSPVLERKWVCVCVWYKLSPKYF